MVLDTNTLSEIKDNNIDLADAKELDVSYYVPITQELEFLDGIDNLSDELRDSIREVLEELDPEEVKLDSAPFGVVPFGRGPFGTVSDTYKDLLEIMNDIDEHENNPWDVLGAETAISRDMEFVTRDDTLQRALQDYSPEHLLRYEEYRKLVELC